MNYIAIIGDIKNSKTITNRNQVQEKLNNVLKHINETYYTDIEARFIITLGDEFQGLLKNYEHILDITQYIQQKMYPVNLRFGIGVGKIYTKIFYEAAIGADGPAYYAAREMVKQIRKQEKKYKNVLLHSLKYYIAVILVILPVFSLDMFLAAIYAALAHFLIDTIEYVYLTNSKNIRKTELFIAHQCAHLTSILILAYIMECWNFSIGHIEIVRNILNVYNYNPEILIRWILAILFIHSPVNTFIQNFLAGYKPDKDNGEIIIKTNNKAGRRIGTVERMIMLIFLSLDQYTAIGFVLTAKSVARYSSPFSRILLYILLKKEPKLIYLPDIILLPSLHLF